MSAIDGGGLMNDDINERMSPEETDALDSKLAGYGARGAIAQAKAIAAFARLLALAETRDSGQIARVARFLASTYNGHAFPFDLFELRCLDVAISDDMLACLDCLRWGTSDLWRLVPDGDKRVRAVIKAWGFEWPKD